MSLLFRRAVRSKDKKIAEAYKTAYNKMLKDHGKKKKKKRQPGSRISFSAAL
jgi:hypothetical protein